MNIYQNIMNGMLFESIRVFDCIIIIPLQSLLLLIILLHECIFVFNKIQQNSMPRYKY